MTAPIERELKLDVSPDFHLPDLTTVPGFSMVTKPEKTLVATYYDTSSLDLARWGATLRYRATAGGSGEWTVKLDPAETAGTSPPRGTGKGGRGQAAEDAGSATTDRYEIEIESGPGQVPRKALELTNGLRRGRSLEAVAELTTVRRAHVILDPDGTELAELDDDRVEFVTRSEPARSGGFREIEVELLRATPAEDDRSESEWTHAIYNLLAGSGAVRNDGTPKLMRALGSVPPPLRSARAVPGASTLAALVSATVEAALHRLLSHEIGVRLGSDPEDIHKCRVATRRLRADLRSLEPLFEPDATVTLVEGLAPLARALGEVRDADVLEARLLTSRARLDAAEAGELDALVTGLRRERGAAHGRLLRQLNQAAHGRLVGALFALMEDPPLRDPKADAAERILPVLADRWSTLARAVDDLSDQPSDAELHGIHKKAKGCRYAADMATPVLGKRTRRLSKAVAEVQDVLGTVQDASVAMEWLRRSVLSAAPERALVAGRLIETEASRAQAARQEWRRAWKHASDPRRVKWLAQSS